VPMDETSLRVVRDLLDGRGDEPASPEVAERRATIRSSSLLRPLFIEAKR